ncbi:MAG: hypothetical protein WCV93_02345 [Candidatus Shapirobacteria bacterium]
MNNNQYLEYMNLTTDAKRAVYELVSPEIGNNSYFLRQYLFGISQYFSHLKNFRQSFNLDLLESSNTNPKIKAEYLLDNNRIILNFIKKSS